MWLGEFMSASERPAAAVIRPAVNGADGRGMQPAERGAIPAVVTSELTEPHAEFPLASRRELQNS